LEEIGAMMVNVMDFFNKTLGITRTNNIHLFKVEMVEWNMMSTLMLGNGTLEGIYGTATHELGHSWFQHVLASMNQNTLGWMRDLQPMFQI
jgi:hypothetical protein